MDIFNARRIAYIYNLMRFSRTTQKGLFVLELEMRLSLRNTLNLFWIYLICKSTLIKYLSTCIVPSTILKYYSHCTTKRQNQPRRGKMQQPIWVTLSTSFDRYRRFKKKFFSSIRSRSAYGRTVGLSNLTLPRAYGLYRLVSLILVLDYY